MGVELLGFFYSLLVGLSVFDTIYWGGVGIWPSLLACGRTVLYGVLAEARKLMGYGYAICDLAFTLRHEMGRWDGMGIL